MTCTSSVPTSQISQRTAVHWVRLSTWPSKRDLSQTSTKSSSGTTAILGTVLVAKTSLTVRLVRLASGSTLTRSGVSRRPSTPPKMLPAVSRVPVLTAASSLSWSRMSPAMPTLSTIRFSTAAPASQSICTRS